MATSANFVDFDSQDFHGKTPMAQGFFSQDGAVSLEDDVGRGTLEKSRFSWEPCVNAGFNVQRFAPPNTFSDEYSCECWKKVKFLVGE